MDYASSPGARRKPFQLGDGSEKGRCHQHYHNNAGGPERSLVVEPRQGSTVQVFHKHPHNPFREVKIHTSAFPSLQLTSLLISTTKMLLRISVFIPCFRANFMSLFSCSAATTALVGFLFSTSGSPVHAAPTSHHFPLFSAERRSSRVTRKGS